MTTGRGTSTTRSTGLCTTRSILFTLKKGENKNTYCHCHGVPLRDKQVQELSALNQMHKWETEKLGEAQQAHGQLARRAAPQGRQPPPVTVQALFYGSHL